MYQTTMEVAQLCLSSWKISTVFFFRCPVRYIQSQAWSPHESPWVPWIFSVLSPHLCCLNPIDLLFFCLCIYVHTYIYTYCYWNSIGIWIYTCNVYLPIFLAEWKHSPYSGICLSGRCSLNWLNLPSWGKFLQVRSRYYTPSIGSRQNL